MSTTLTPGLDLCPYLRRAEADGVAVVSGAIRPAALPPLVQLLDQLAFFTPPADALPHAIGCELAVLQKLDGAEDPARRAVRELRDELAERVRRDGRDVAALRNWRPNEVFVRLYRRGSTGMAPHRDGLRFFHLVATVTVLGTATFLLCDDTDGPLEQWPLAPGDLVLLRGANGTGGVDRRPRHAVTGPGWRPRCSVAFRMRVDSAARR